MIDEVRDQNRALYELWSIENVLGAKKYMSERATVLTGFYFGLRVSRGRLFETSFDVHLDDAVLRGARRLECRSCLGARWPRAPAVPPMCCSAARLDGTVLGRRAL